MTDTPRTTSYLLNAFRDGQVSRSITPQMQRDFIVSMDSRAPFSIVQYGAVGDGSTNNTTAIQAAIDACNAAGGGTVFVPPGTFLINDGLTLKPGVFMQGVVGSPGYFDGYDSYGSVANTGTASRIKANTGFHGGVYPEIMITLDTTDTTSAARAKGYGFGNIILDGNGNATEIIHGPTSSFIERVLTLSNVVVMRASESGLATTNMMIRAYGSKFVGNGVYGVNCNPLTDSYFTDCFVHSNATGGYAFSDGSGHLTISGGKIEENFGYGVTASTGGGAVQIKLVGVDFQHNSKSAVKAYGSGVVPAFVSLHSCTLDSNGYPQTLGDGAQLQTDGIGRIRADNCIFRSINGQPYHLAATNSGKLWHGNSTYMDPGATANTYTATSGTIVETGGLISSIA